MENAPTVRFGYFDDGVPYYVVEAMKPADADDPNRAAILESHEHTRKLIENAEAMHAALRAIDNLMTNYPESTGEECAEIARAALAKVNK